MKIEVLYFDGCPNHDALLPRLRELLDQLQVASPVELVDVPDDPAAQRERFLGSPTLRVDGRDIEPGAEARTDFGLKCRLYRTVTGMSGTPPQEWVLAALGIPPDPAEPGISGSWASQRVDGLSAEHRDVHRQILRAFADGIEPTPERVAGWAAAAEVEPDDAMAALAARDLVHRDPQTGAIVVAYPFSGVPTGHRLRLASGIEVFAMCAIDALGIAFMLDQHTTVHSSDPQTGEPIAVTVHPAGESEWTPASAGVLVARARAGESASCICPHTNFAASPQSGRSLLDQTPGLAGHVLSMDDAIATGRDTFAELLAPRP